MPPHPGSCVLAYADPGLQERVLAAPLARVAAATITDAPTLRRKLAEVRRLGHAVAPGSIEDVATGLAVPVRDRAGQVVAALSVIIAREAPVEAPLSTLHRAARDIRSALEG
ncbi:IclR family transcriptional regulator domain-containing protein [Microbacterium elymi]|uniref:IclR-ED domain-containing protein n=1 Tax=Microbacterium elymi TaxID=2909587 RepID=A0ABY5NN24_9MICO|nr:IclR family transcriptional regulator C-terminal domain-containing protein [Microbacterium elymi]UUT36570.1 hypothetical protein L2X98_24450 [Microbacterium elymi]